MPLQNGGLRQQSFVPTQQNGIRTAESVPQYIWSKMSNAQHSRRAAQLDKERNRQSHKEDLGRYPTLYKWVIWKERDLRCSTSRSRGYPIIHSLKIKYLFSNFWCEMEIVNGQIAYQFSAAPQLKIGSFLFTSISSVNIQHSNGASMLIRISLPI